MTRRIAVAFVIGFVAPAAPALAQDGDFCGTLKAAWTVAKDAPKTLGEQRIAGASLCAPREGNLQCSWLLGTKEAGRATYDRFKAEATACMAPLGLQPNVLNTAGADTTALESPEGQPDVAIIYPGNATVTVSVLLPN